MCWFLLQSEFIFIRFKKKDDEIDVHMQENDAHIGASLSYQKCDKGEDEETLKKSLLSNRDKMSQEVIFHLKKQAI